MFGGRRGGADADAWSFSLFASRDAESAHRVLLQSRPDQLGSRHGDGNCLGLCPGVGCVASRSRCRPQIRVMKFSILECGV